MGIYKGVIGYVYGIRGVICTYVIVSHYLVSSVVSSGKMKHLPKCNKAYIRDLYRVIHPGT